MQIGPYQLINNLFLAPMAGVTDRPFRQLCKSLGAGYTVSEMAASNPLLWATDKSTRRINHEGENTPIAVQIAGSDPAMMAHAAQFNIERGAQIIDINMGCPAKKVCNAAAGSALLKDEWLVRKIIEAVVTVGQANQVPVTLKFRTGWSKDQKNALHIAQLAQSLGIAMLTLHGRTRECGYSGAAEYDTIAQVKSRGSIPVVANGDITTPEKARDVLAYTGADAIMIGRAAQGKPWIFREVAHFLATGEHLAAPAVAEIHTLLRKHLFDHHQFYGEYLGVLTARKHLLWYLTPVLGRKHVFLSRLVQLNTLEEQVHAIDYFFGELAKHHDVLPDVNSISPDMHFEQPYFLATPYFNNQLAA